MHLHLNLQDQKLEIPGMMISPGNVGPALKDMTLSNMYLTRDGGIHWKEVAKDPHIWAVGGQGGLLVFVNNKMETTKLRYINLWRITK